MANSTDKMRHYLKSLTKDELIHLIFKFGPPIFFENIKSQFASKKEALTQFNKTAKKIGTLLSDEELLYNPSEFEHELLKQLERIEDYIVPQKSDQWIRQLLPLTLKH